MSATHKYEFGHEYIGAKLHTNDFSEALAAYRRGVTVFGKDSVYLTAPFCGEWTSPRGLTDAENEQVDRVLAESQAIFIANGGTRTEEA